MTAEDRAKLPPLLSGLSNRDLSIVARELTLLEAK